MNSKLSRDGFTLIEILIVLTIIGVTLSFAMLSFGDFGKQRRLKLAALQFIQMVELVQEEALLAGNVFSVKFTPNGYQVLRLNSENHWLGLRANVFRRHIWPKGSHINVESEQKYPRTQIVIHPCGDITPFIMTIGTSDKAKWLTITGLQDGQINLRTTDIK